MKNTGKSLTAGSLWPLDPDYDGRRLFHRQVHLPMDREERETENGGVDVKTNGKNSKSMRFGGPWTKEKLEVLEKYLRAYTTALKKQGFKLMYIDAFAGSGGFLEKHSRNARSFILGSTQRSIKIDKKPFDKLIFVEIDPNRCNELENLRKEHPGRNIEVINSEANKFLSKLNEDWCRWRGVLFLDQFSTEVEWSTVEKIASFEALDTWILFSSSAISRMLPLSKRPDDIEPKWAERLIKVYGDESWRNLYQEIRQMNLCGELDVEYRRNPGVDGPLNIYKKKLSSLFGERFLSKSRTLKNSKNSPLFEFIFCVGHPGGICLAKKIATDILESM